MLRSRKSRGEVSLGADTQEDKVDAEHEAMLADSVGLALLVVLETLAPVERLAFVLHDMFAMPFDEIARIVGRSATATRQLASRARRRVHGALPVSDVELTQQREVVGAFLAAVRSGDFGALVALLDSEVTVRAGVMEVRGATDVAKQALIFSQGVSSFTRLALVNGTVGLVVAPGGRLVTVLGFTFAGREIVEIDVFNDPARFHELTLAVLAD